MSTSRTGRSTGPQDRKPAAPVVVQPKLEVGSAYDPLEAEADRVAAAFSRWQGSGVLAAGTAEAPPVARVRRSAAGPDAGFTAPADVERRIDAARGGGEALPDAQRGRFESFFGADLSDVRVHRGAESSDLNRAISARAFTTGTDVFIGAGESTTGSGEQLLAHELTHVVQQSGGARRTVRRVLGEDTAEQVADKGNAVSEVAEQGGNLAAAAKGAEDPAVADALGAASVGLIGGIADWWKTCIEMITLFNQKNAAGEEKAFTALHALNSLGTVTKQAMTTAQTVGKECGVADAGLAAAIPGLDVAVCFVALISHVGRLAQLASSKSQQDLLLASAAASAKDMAARERVAKLTAVQSVTSRAFYATAGKVVADIVAASGSIVQLTIVGAPAGAALKIIGAVGGLCVGLADYMFEQARLADLAVLQADEAAAAKAASDAPESAVAQGAAATARLARLELDVGTAVDDLLDELLNAPPLTPDEEEDPTINAVFAPLGIGKEWLARFEDLAETDKPAAKAEARQLIITQLGIREDPNKAAQAVIVGSRRAAAFVAVTAGKAKQAMGDLFKDKDVVAARHDTKVAAKAALEPALEAKIRTGGDITPDWANALLQSSIGRFEAMAQAEKNEAKKSALWDAIEIGVTKAITQTIGRVMPRGAIDKLSVIGIHVMFDAFSLPKPAAAASGGSAAPATPATAAPSGLLAVPSLVTI